MVVANDLTGALDRKQHHAVLFVGLSKAFDSVYHKLLLNKLVSVLRLLIGLEIIL